MQPILSFVKSTIVGGFLFLVPVGIVLVVLGRLFAHAQGAAVIIHDRAFPSTESALLASVIAVLILIFVAFMAGAFLRTQLGQRLFRALEDRILMRVPMYTLARQMIGDMTGGTALLSGAAQTEVVLVQLDDMQVLGFMIERGDQGKAVIYLPGAPSALSGSVAIVAQDRILPTNLLPSDVMASMRRLGSGLTKLEREAFGKNGMSNAPTLAEKDAARR